MNLIHMKLRNVKLIISVACNEAISLDYIGIGFLNVWFIAFPFDNFSITTKIFLYEWHEKPDIQF